MEQDNSGEQCGPWASCHVKFAQTTHYDFFKKYDALSENYLRYILTF